MRRPAAALLGTLAGTVLLVGAKYGSAPPAATAGDSVASNDSGPTDPGTTDAGSALPSDAPAGPSGSAVPGTGTAPVPSGRTSATTAAGRATPTAGRTTGGPPPTTAPSCTTTTGSATNVASPGIGAITVTIKVCGGVLKTSTGAQSRSNWDTNTAAVPTLNTLAVKNYKTNFSAIHYSGATLTSTAYRASLRSAMTKAGI